jgi:glutathione peroxidase
MSNSLYDIPLQKIDGASSSLGDYRGKVLLVVNVASKCGLTPQYEGLEKLYQSKSPKVWKCWVSLPTISRNRNRVVMRKSLSSALRPTMFTFPLFSKISVVGADQHSLYTALTAAQPETTGEGPFRERLKGYGIESDNTTDVLWNFEKFLIDRHGKVVARFAPDIAVDDSRLLAAIEAQLNLEA